MRTVLLSFAKWAVLVVIFAVLFSIGGQAFAVAPATPMSEAEQGVAFLALLVVAAFDCALIAVLAWHSRLPRTALAVVLVAVFYFVKTFTSTIEAAVFMPNVNGGNVGGLFLLTVPLTLVVMPLAAFFFGRGPSEGESVVALPSMSLGALLGRVGVISVVVYPVLFFVFGYFVAFASAEVRTFYGVTELKPFFAHMLDTVTQTPWILPFEMLRGLLWTLAALVVFSTTRGGAIAKGVLVALLFALVQNDVHLLPNPLMGREVQAFHFMETATSNAIFAMVAAWLLAGAGGLRGRTRTSR